MKSLFSLTLAQLMSAAGLLLIVGCEQDKAPAPLSQETLTSPIVVTVNGQSITEETVDFTISQMFGEDGRNHATPELRNSVVNSLIASKAMSMAVTQQLDSETAKQLELKVAAFKEELLVKQFLQQNVTPTPVSSAMVTNYYQQHPEEFGAVEQLNLELAIQAANTSEQQRKLLFAKLENLQSQQDWSASSALFTQLNLSLKTELVETSSLPIELQAITNNLSVGSTSKPTLINGDVYILRLLSKRQLPPKPLSEVSVDIRKRLAPIQLKKAVKEASDIATNAATIEWNNAPQQ
ncbi:peptidyl-prolyl cis-trans isomerase [Agarivorans albus]|uniref:PpiC domain-containing protein n=1 Tax=Agarivorans albus MKT 106 TaxID=1331007 RepID=R9PRF3_AGAAL|nr:peptidylprolyl isomerase [Agarivorans albus]GAD03838.1 hypothetical protein AALB_3918 [Agarivorans albus MKT 106]